MKYEELAPLSRPQAEEALNRADESGTVMLLLRLANTEDTAGEWEWKQNLCLSYTAAASPEIRRASVQALGDLARIHGQLDVEKVKAAFTKLRNHHELRGSIEDALSDIRIFVRGETPEG